VRVTGMDSLYSTTPLIDTFKMQADRSDKGLATGDVTEVVLLNVGLSRAVDVARELTSEVAPGPRAMMQKFNFVCASAGEDALQRYILFYPLAFGTSADWTNPASRSDITPWTFFGHYAALFAGVRGSVRIKGFINDPRNASSTETLIQAPPYPLYGSVCATGLEELGVIGEWPPVVSVVQSLSPTTGIEMSFPYSSMRKYYNPRIVCSFDSPATSLERTCCIRSGVAYASTWLTPEINWFYAAGDDVTVTRFRRVPAFIAATVMPAT